MVTSEDFPLPEVAEALSPFIKPRDEVKAIRQDLQAYLKSHLDTKDAPLTVATLSDPSPRDPNRGPPEALSGVRKAYYRALQTHFAAQTRYDNLKAELERLSQDGTGRPNDQRPDELADASEYVTVLRQRQKLRKLRAIDQALEETTAVGDDLLAKGLEEKVHSQTGQAPASPAATTIDPGTTSDVEEKVMELRRAILTTKRSIDAVQARSQAEDAQRSSKGEAHALQRAHDELSTWIEQQLVTISETEPARDNYEEQNNHHPTREGQEVAAIESLYTRYTTARTQILSTIANSPANPEETNVTQTQPNGLRPQQLYPTPTTNPAPATILLPHLSALLHAKESNQYHTQTTTHLRRALATSNENTRRLFARLAEESHLVAPGVEKGEAWLKAGSEASRELEAFVREQVAVGVKAIGDGGESLTCVEELRVRVGRVVQGHTGG